MQIANLGYKASPSLSVETINARLDLVSAFRVNRGLREEVINFLRRTYDSQRLMQRFSMGRGDADDLLALLRTIEATTQLASVLIRESAVELTWHDNLPTDALNILGARLSLDKPNALASSIAAAIDEDALVQSHRAEESSAEVVTLAEDVLQNEGSVEDLDAFSAVVPPKATLKASADTDSEETDTWIMRKT